MEERVIDMNIVRAALKVEHLSRDGNTWEWLVG